MAVTLVVPFQPEVPVFNMVHMENLTISIEQNNYAKSALIARLRLYYIDANGDKVFDKAFTDVSIPDAQKWAVDAALLGDMRGVQAANNITALLALIVETQTGYGSAVVS